MVSDNLLARLDSLELQVAYLRDELESFEPRLNATKKRYNLKNDKVLKKLEALKKDDKEEQLLLELDKVKLEFLERKTHHVIQKGSKLLYKRLLNQLEHDPKNKYKKLVDQLSKYELTLDQISENYLTSKLLKLTVPKIKKYHNKEYPSWFQNHSFVGIEKDKRHQCNSSYLWNNVITKLDSLSALISKVMNEGQFKELVSSYEHSLDILLNVNKELWSTKRQQQRGKTLKDSKSATHNVNSESNDDDSTNEDLDNDSSTSVLGDVDDVSRGDHARSVEEGLDDEHTLEQMDTMLAGSDSESGEDNAGYDLPELMGGYYSGGSEDDSDDDGNIRNDEIAKRQMSNKPERKNRRGQRARRKIWEQKYGTKAKHIQREFEKQRESKRKRQEEFEERVAKRAAREVEERKAMAEYRDSLKSQPIKEVKKSHLEEHPSWLAKKQAEQKEKNAKFMGKKVVFD